MTYCFSLHSNQLFLFNLIFSEPLCLIFFSPYRAYIGQLKEKHLYLYIHLARLKQTKFFYSFLTEKDEHCLTYSKM